MAVAVGVRGRCGCRRALVELVPQPVRLAECSSSRGLRHHALGRHGGREDPAAGGGQGASPPAPRPGEKIAQTGPAPGY